MVTDTGMKGLDSAQMLADLESSAEPLSGLLNPETGEATKVEPDSAGWPKAKITPGLPAQPEDNPAPPGLPEVPGMPAQAAAAGIPPLEAPKLPEIAAPPPPKQVGAQEPAELANLETGEVTQVLPDDAGWPKAKITPGLAEMMPQDAPGAELPGGSKLPDQLPGGADATMIKKPDVALPGAQKGTEIANLETGDTTTIMPDPANWPKASVKPGTPPELPKPPEAPDVADLLKDPLKELQDQLDAGPTIPK